MNRNDQVGRVTAALLGYSAGNRVKLNDGLEFFAQTGTLTEQVTAYPKLKLWRIKLDDNKTIVLPEFCFCPE